VIPSLSFDAIRGLYTALAGQAEDCTLVLAKCFFHAVEALVEVEELEGIDPMPLFVLRAFEFAHPADVENLDGILHIGQQVMRQMLNGMAANGLVVAESESTYRLTDLGHSTLQTGHVIRRIRSRRVFRFLHPALNYVAVHDPKGNLLNDLSPNHVPSPWEFNPEALRYAIAQSADWKRQHGFPANVADVITEPRSLEATEPVTPEAGLVSATAESSHGQATPLQHLIVDKSQVVTCALVVRQCNADDVGLAAYPVSKHGTLIRSNSLPLFSLHDPIEVGQVVPGLSGTPSPQEITDGWLTLAARLMLPEAEQAEVRFENNLLVVSLSSDHLGRWMNFVALAMQNQLFWQVPQEHVLRLCKVAVVGADSATTTQLQVLRSVLSLEQDARRGAIVQSEDSLREWLATQGLPHDLSSRDLADVAFRFGRYRLAYEIGELEDMSDASV
jgi:hypothetical protein